MITCTTVGMSSRVGMLAPTTRINPLRQGAVALLVMTILLLGTFALPTVALGQAECGKNGHHWTDFLNTGLPSVQVRCLCAHGGAAYGDWLIQFRNTGSTPANVNYVLVKGQTQKPPQALSLAAHGVSTERRANMWGCQFDQRLFITVSDRN
jgi:hypothetical protein